MTTTSATGTIERLAAFVTTATPPAPARAAARTAVIDTIGVALAGTTEPVSRIVRETAAVGAGPCTVLGADGRASAEDAALCNGTAAHALDFDDMCFVSLAHPSAPLVPAVLAAAELVGASGRALLDAYVVGFEIEARLGRVMNPRHYQRGWHCTATLGVIGAAAGVSRILELDARATARALAIAASTASGLKENFGTMVKPLHAGLAARNGVLAARLAKAGLTASADAIDGPQGFLRALDSEGASVTEGISDLGTRWEILDTGITVKLYPSCAGTHPTLDTVLDLQREHGFTADDVEAIDVGVDAITPTVLIYDRPATGLEAKFSMPFCVAAAVVSGRVGLDTFVDIHADARVTAFMPRVGMFIDTSLDAAAPPLTEARIVVRLTGGRTLERAAHGARGYPARPASALELDGKFLDCAGHVLTAAASRRLLDRLGALDSAEIVPDIISRVVDFAGSRR